MRRDGWLPFALSFILALIGGLIYAWQVDPTEYIETAPHTLRTDFKADYMALIAASYASSQDILRAQARLNLFSESDPGTTLAALAQQRLAEGRPESEARALALLAAALGEQPTPFVRTPGALETALASNPSSTPDIRIPPQASRTPAFSLVPSTTPTLEIAGGFELRSMDKVCDPNLAHPLLQALVLDALSHPLPGMEVLVVWDTGQDHFFTGLKPELGLGYGDFTMTEGVTYAVQIVGSTELVTGLSTEDCMDNGGDVYPGSWLLTFAQRFTP